MAFDCIRGTSQNSATLFLLKIVPFVGKAFYPADCKWQVGVTKLVQWGSKTFELMNFENLENFKITWKFLHRGQKREKLKTLRIFCQLLLLIKIQIPYA